jgi:hypothetical protein
MIKICFEKLGQNNIECSIGYYYLKKPNYAKIKRVMHDLEDYAIELETINKLREVYEIRKKRNIRAVVFLALFILCFELSLFIIMDVIGLAPIFAIILGILGVIFLAYGIYLIIHNPPIYIE